MEFTSEGPGRPAGLLRAARQVVQAAVSQVPAELRPSQALPASEALWRPVREREDESGAVASAGAFRLPDLPDLSGPSAADITRMQLQHVLKRSIEKLQASRLQIGRAHV